MALGDILARRQRLDGDYDCEVDFGPDVLGRIVITAAAFRAGVATVVAHDRAAVYRERTNRLRGHQ